MNRSHAPQSRDGACRSCASLQRRLHGLRARNKHLVRSLLQTQSQLAQAQDRIRELEQTRRPTACNSSIPPSANPIGAPRPTIKRPTGRKPGGQFGHPGKGKMLLPIQRMDQVIRHRPAVCAHCQTPLDEQCAGELTGRHQVAELPACAVKLTEHQSYACRCECCGKVTRALIPPEIVASATGPRLTAAIGILGAWVKGSRRAVAEVIGQTLGCPIALGSISAREVELTQALQQPYEELASRLSQAPVKYVDETGWKLRGQNRWLFVAATPQEVLFKVERNRTRPALLRLLGGKARGTICSDRCVIYELWPLDKRQLCWAHLKRDFVAAVERGGPGQVPAQQALDITAEIFELWRDFKAGRLTRRQLREQIKPLQSKMRHALESGARCGQKKTAGLCRRLLKREQAMWRFIDTRGLDPTNNLAERMLRPAVIWRKKSFGCHSQQGCHYVERMLSVIQTLRLRGVDVLDYLSAAVEAHRKGLPPPALPPPVNERPTETSGKPQTDAVTPFALDLRKVA